MNINKLVVAGRLTKDPELRQTPNGKSVVQFSVATNKVWKDTAGNKQESTEFFNVVAWGKTAESINTYFKKGKEIYLEGRVQTRSWEGENGKKNYRTEMVAETFQFVGSDKQSAPQNDGYNAPSDDYGTQPDSGDGGQDISVEDIPF